MSLREDITQLLDLTHRLAEKLEQDELAACNELLAQRDHGIRRLANSRRHATGAEITACSPLLAELEGSDRDLQRRGQASLTALGRELARSRTTALPSRDPAPLCVDRKA